MMDRFIVAEVSKNWTREGHAESDILLSQAFEKIINHWAKRGYHLYQFSLHRMIVAEDNMNETIIAVFEKTT